MDSGYKTGLEIISPKNIKTTRAQTRGNQLVSLKQSRGLLRVMQVETFEGKRLVGARPRGNRLHHVPSAQLTLQRQLFSPFLTPLKSRTLPHTLNTSVGTARCSGTKSNSQCGTQLTVRIFDTQKNFVIIENRTWKFWGRRWDHFKWFRHTVHVEESGDDEKVNSYR